MQTQMEACKLKAERRITMEVSKERFQVMKAKLTNEKTTEMISENWRLTEEIAKKAFLLYTVVDLKKQYRGPTTNTGGRNRGSQRQEVVRNKDKRTPAGHATMRNSPHD